ncbi:unnamed protein product [Adineta steineri]|uniref:Uncharacterized protein n=1 Tax=Adineta steineri TaxID=433720 RepID=A0A814G643_9BILA|nr:unnamed protein product [Adineta steineri]CAF1482100.1 unnamed protein product [Adineta steineri]
MMRPGGWFSINNIIDSHSEDELNNYAVMALKFRDLRLDLNKRKALSNTILILLGDHGLHGHNWKELWREFDHRNPFLQILLQSFFIGFNDIIKHLNENSDKLITHGDIYMTFTRFFNSSLPLVLPKGINLFTQKISDDRTCRIGQIPGKWCNCWIPKLCL